jgi:hypothetical protein
MRNASRSWLFICGLVFVHATVNAEESNSEFKRPELIAILWGPDDGVQFKSLPSAAWRSDGTLVPAEEVKWLYDSGSLTIREVSRVRSALRPVVVVFRVDERAQPPLRLVPKLITDFEPWGERDWLPQLGQQGHTKHHLFAARISTPLAEWPADIKLDLRTPMAAPTVLHVLDGARLTEFTPEKPLQVDKGVTWCIGMSTITLPGGDPAQRYALLSVDQSVVDPSGEWAMEGTLKDGTPLEVRQIVRRGTVMQHRFELSEGISLNRVELLRRRYRTEQYEQVPLRVDLLPK